MSRGLGLAALSIGLGLPLLWAACAEDRECSTDGDCEGSQVCSRLGQCVGGSQPVIRDSRARDFGDLGMVSPRDIPDIDAGDMDAGVVMDMDGGAIMDMDSGVIEDMDAGAEEDMGVTGMVGPPMAVPALTALTQDVILEVERVSSSGSQVLRATSGARVDPSSRSCTETVSPPQNGLNGQRCVIVERDCDGPGTALPTGSAAFDFTLNGGARENFTQATSPGPTWVTNTLSPTGLFTSPVNVVLEVSTLGATGGLVPIPATAVPTPRDFVAINPDPGIRGSLDLSLTQQINFNTNTGTGAVFFELFDQDRSRILRCEAPVAAASFFAFDPGILDDYRDTLSQTAEPEYFLEIGFDEGVTREVPIAGGGTVEVAFNFKWVSRYVGVVP